MVILAKVTETRCQEGPHTPMTRSIVERELLLHSSNPHGPPLISETLKREVQRRAAVSRLEMDVVVACGAVPG
jgi:hypothetical protein